MEFLHVGSTDIYNSKLIDIKDSDSLETVKPIGGFWLSEFVAYDYNAWVTLFLEDKKYIYYHKYGCSDNIPCVVVHVNMDNIYILDSSEKLDYLMTNFSSNDSIISFEKLKNYYNGLYVNLYAIGNDKRYTLFKAFAVNSLVLFNLESIFLLLLLIYFIGILVNCFFYSVNFRLLYSLLIIL